MRFDVVVIVVDGMRAERAEDKHMKIGFISPSFRPLETNWMHDFEMVKLGVPTMMGYLHRAGFRDVEHWDFDAQICDVLENDPSAFDLRQYFDRARIDGFLAGRDESLRAQTDRLLDTLGVAEKNIFGISLSAVLDRIVNVNALAALAQCMAHVLKERYPACVIVIGGLQASPDSVQPELYMQYLRECDAIDYACIGRGDDRAVELIEAIAQGRSCEIRGVVSRVGPDRTPVLRVPEGDSGSKMTTNHHRSHTRTGAREMLGEVLQAPAPTEATVPASALARTRAAARDAFEDGPSASADAPLAPGPGEFQEFESLPARVPVFDKNLVDRFRYTGAQVMKRFHFDKELLLKYARFENDTIVVLPHIFVQGCNAPCGFCSYAYTKIQGEHVRDTVAGLEWLSETYGCNAFHFLNTQINSVYEYCDAFCEEILRRGLRVLWSDCANMRFLDEKLLEKMRRAGAVRLVYGVEAPEDEMLQYIHKGITVDRVERLLKVSHELGIWNHVLLIAGMPHETKAKQDRMMDFLVRTAPSMDFYSISSFYLIANSPWGREPEKFGIERVSDPNDLLENQGFNEIADGRWSSEGLRWPEKKQQIIESTQRFYRTISEAKGQSRCVGGNIDLYLLMFLYSILGHDKKSEITEIYAKTAASITSARSQRSSDDTPNRAEINENVVRIDVPVIIGRVNEADQSALVHLALDIVVSSVVDSAEGFVRTKNFVLSYRQPRIESGASIHLGAMPSAEAQWKRALAEIGRVLGPFANALEARLEPTSPARMAELIAKNLPRYPAWKSMGYPVIDTPRERSVMQRTLQWSGLAS